LQWSECGSLKSSLLEYGACFLEFKCNSGYEIQWIKDLPEEDLVKFTKISTNFKAHVRQEPIQRRQPIQPESIKHLSATKRIIPRRNEVLGWSARDAQACVPGSHLGGNWMVVWCEGNETEMPDKSWRWEAGWRWQVHWRFYQVAVP